MIEAYGDIWDHINEYDAVVITTNGFVKKNGEAVMGRGIALEAKTRYPDFPARLGFGINLQGNKFQVIAFDKDDGSEEVYFALPVKPAWSGNQPGWKARADINLIKRSIQDMVDYVDTIGYFDKILMPRPGCGNGGLKWEQVKPVIEPYLDDRFTVMHKLL